MKNLRELNAKGIGASVICVISDQNYMFWKELFDFFADHDVEYIDIVPCYEKNGRYTLTEEHYIDFYTHAFGLWLDNGKRPFIRTFQNIINLFTGKIQFPDFVTCSLTGRCGDIISGLQKGMFTSAIVYPRNPQI